MNKKDIMKELNNIVESQEAKMTMARELKLLYDSFITAGFDDCQAMHFTGTILVTLINKLNL